MAEPAKFGRREWVLSAAVLFALALVIFTASQDATGNADYICTRVIAENGDCANGAWGDWVKTGTSADENACVLTTTEQRTYTGTRTIRHTITYLNLRTSCDAGFVQQDNGDGGSGTSGFHGGSIVTESAACQVVETRRTRSPITTGVCAAKTPAISTTIVTTDSEERDGQVVTTSQDLRSKDEIDSFRRSVVSSRIAAKPQLVRSGQTSLISWQGVEMGSCTVTGKTVTGKVINTWNSTSGEQTSAPIPEKTTFTLVCSAFSGEQQTSSVEVDVTPQWQED